MNEVAAKLRSVVTHDDLGAPANQHHLVQLAHDPSARQ